MKFVKNVALAGLLLATPAILHAQSQTDAYRFAVEELSGTARYLSMGGAFGALGGDVSVLKANPAGLAVYRSSEIVGTLGLNSTSAKSNWNGTSEKVTNTKFNLDNIAYVGYFPTGKESGVVSWNFGLSYNRQRTFNRNYSMTTNDMNVSLSDYAAAWVTNRELAVNDIAFPNKGDYNPYNNIKNDFFSVLAYDAGYIDAYSDNDKRYYSTFSENDGTPYPIDRSRLRVEEHGSIGEYDIAFGFNVSDFLMVGATMRITDMDYHYASYYTENFSNGSFLSLGTADYPNGLSTKGTGYGVNVGVIAVPAPFLRVGVAYNSSTWYRMSDYFYTKAETDVPYFDKPLISSTPENATFDYRYQTPDKWIFSLASVLGTRALISVDYEISNFSNMKLKDFNKYDLPANEFIKEDFGLNQTLRAGVEFKVTPQFSLRAGGSWQSVTMSQDILDGNVEVVPAGTTVHYTLDQGVTNYTFGLGYRFTPHWYTDIACVLRTHKEKAYAFSSIFTDYGEDFFNQPADLKTKTTKVALTVGYKF